MYQPYVAVLPASQVPSAGGSSGKALRQSSLSSKQHQLTNVYQVNGVNSYNQLPMINASAAPKQIQKADLTKEQSA